LTPSPPGYLQWFPQEYWRDEFALAAKLGIDYIELISEVQHNPNNPLWSDAGVDEVKALVDANGLTLHALCNDYVIEHTLPGDPAVLRQAYDLIARGHKLGMEKLILPLFDASELTPDNQRDYIGPVRDIAEAAQDVGMITCLETVLTGAELIGLLDHLDRPFIKVVYDTGNRVAFGHDLAGDIRLLGERIAHVHIKDKNADNANVLLGTGLVNFAQVFWALRDIDYGGPFTFETFRGSDPLRTARYNMNLVTFFKQDAGDDA
jgi:D-psicose/D-tagatose/L-ribulose 3-epimerase